MGASGVFQGRRARVACLHIRGLPIVLDPQAAP